MESMDTSSISMAALGRVAHLGFLYDARTDQFINSSIFNQEIPESAQEHCDNNFTDIQLIYKDKFSEKFAKLNVNAELRVRIFKLNSV